VPGYEDADIDVSRKSAKVTYDPAQCSPKDLVTAINEHTSFKASTKS